MGFSLQEFFSPWLKGTPEDLERFLRDPRAAMSEIVGVPNDIDVAVYKRDGSYWFQASIPRETTNKAGSLGDMRMQNERLKKCPALGVSGSEFINNYKEILATHGIHVPEDVLVEIDREPDGFIHFKVPLEHLINTVKQ